MSRRRRGKRTLHLHAHQHHHQALTIVQSHQPPPVPLVSTMQTLVNAPVRINNTTTRIYAPTVTTMMSPSLAPVVQQNPEDGLAKLITGVLGALIVGASLLANHGGSSRRRQ